MIVALFLNSTYEIIIVKTSDCINPTELIIAIRFVLIITLITNKKLAITFLSIVDKTVPKYCLSIDWPLPPQQPRSKNIGATIVRIVIPNP